MFVMATEVNETEIVLDANHPLAGMTLNFDVEVVAIREATSEELELGYTKKKNLLVIQMVVAAREHFHGTNHRHCWLFRSR